jgi:hypothetical protein
MRFVIDEEAHVPRVVANYSMKERWYAAFFGILGKITSPNI